MPPGWAEGFSKSRRRPYYYHAQFKIQQWYPPPAVTPVASHYDSVAHKELRKEANRQTRETSANRGIRLYNNWVTTCLATRAEEAALSRGLLGDTCRLHILDLAGGKGGGMGKWGHHGATVHQYTLVDISGASVAAAYRRVPNMRWGRDTQFIGMVMDIGTPSSWKCESPVHVVTCHFALNYFGNSPARLQQVLRLARQNVVKGGTLLLTFANWDTIAARVGDQEGWRNSLCDVHVTDRARREYTFTLLPSVERCPEFGVTYPMLEAMAVGEGWTPCEFHADITELPRDWVMKGCFPPSQLREERDISRLYGCAVFDA